MFMVTQNAVTRMKAMREIMASDQASEKKTATADKHGFSWFRSRHGFCNLNPPFNFEAAAQHPFLSVLICVHPWLDFSNLGSGCWNRKRLADSHAAGLQPWIRRHQSIQFNAVFARDPGRCFSGTHCMSLHTAR